MSWYPWNYPALTVNPAIQKILPSSNAVFSEPQEPLRPLRVVVDSRVLAVAKHDDRTAYLLQLLKVPPIESMLYSPDGPPANAQVVIAVKDNAETKRDWISVSGVDDDSLGVTHWQSGAPIVTKGTPGVRHSLLAFRSRNNLDERSAADNLMYQVSKCVKADLLITLSPPSDFPTPDDWNTVTPIPPIDAIPLVGLYLRHQGRFVTYHAPPLGGPVSQPTTKSYERSVFFWNAADVFIPAAARGPSSHRIEFTDDKLAIRDLRSAAIWRIEQALQARDRLFITLSVAPRDHTTADKAAAELELILIWLMAGFDVAARILHLGYGLEGSPHTAGWQSKTWRKKLLSSTNDEMAAFFRPESFAGSIVKLIALLRNSIHGGNPMSSTPVTPVIGEYAMQPFVKIPPADKDEVLRIVKSLGPYESWGIHKPYPDLEHHIHPGKFAERIFKLAVVAINASLEHNPDMNRRSSPGPGFELQHHEKRILWQLGFEEADAPERSRPSAEDIAELGRILQPRREAT